MRINLNTSVLRAIFNLQKDGIDDNTIMRAVYVHQKVIAARRALCRAEAAQMEWNMDNHITNDHKCDIETIAH